MADNKYRAIPLEIGGKFYSLRYDFNAMVALEEVLGKEITFSALGRRGERALIWAGLLHEKNAPTLAQVGDLLTPYLKDPKTFYGVILESAAQAYSNALPEVPKEAEADDSKNAEATPGAGS